MISGHEVKTALAAFLIAAAWPAMPAAALTAPDAFEAILARIDTPRDVPMPFVERRKNALLAEPLVLTGEAVFNADGSLSKTIETPFRERVTITREALEVTREGRTRRLSLRRKDDLRQFYAALRALLEGDARTLRELFEIEATREAERWQLTMTPTGAPLGRFLESMVISGQGSQVLEIRSAQPGGDWQSLSFAGEAP